MRTRRILPLLLAAMALALSSSAADDHGNDGPPGASQEIAAILARPGIGLDDLFRLAELANPHLAVARTNVAAQAGRARQAGLYPNPRFELGIDEMSLDDPELRKTKAMLEQDLILSGRRGAAVASAEAALAAAGQKTLTVRRTTLSQVHKLWAEQLYFREADAAFAELEQVADNTLQIARARFEAKAAPESHVTRALLEVYELEVARQDLDRERARGTAQLTALLGGVEVPADRLSGILDPDAMEAHLPPDVEAVLGDQPALRAARFDIAAAEASLGMARKERFPDLTLVVGYGRFEPGLGNFLEAGVALPLPIFDRNQGSVAENRALAARARHEARIVTSEMEIDLATARLRHRQAHDQLETVAERIAPAAARGLDQAREAYRTGRLMFLELVDAQRTFTDVRLRTLELRKDLAMSEADLMSLLGAGPYADPGVEQ
jgi:cobalt-zinc-cadmium efflux system outer membrane protein